MDTLDVTLEGWDHVPRGYGADFVLDDAPWWLRLWFRIPFIDRYAYPKVVARGHGFLTPHPYCDEAELEAPGPGWRVRSPGYMPPGSESELR